MERKLSWLEQFDLTHAHIRLKNEKILDCYIDGAEPRWIKGKSLRTEEAKKVALVWQEWHENILDKVWDDLEKSGIRKDEVQEIMICREYSGYLFYRDKPLEVA